MRIGCFGVLLSIAIGVFVSMVFGATLIGLVCAWFLSLPFMHGWHRGWAKPWLLAFFSVIFVPCLALFNRD